MAFEYCERMASDYRMLGYQIFRKIIPASLLADLRQAALRVHDLARGSGNPQAQRLQPFLPLLTAQEAKAFDDLTNLPVLVDTIQKVLSKDNILNSGQDILPTGLLIEPANVPWCTAWHRDVRETDKVPDIEEFRRNCLNLIFFNQYNCPLYEDNCTWFVPGSHTRMWDLPSETAAQRAQPRFTDADDITVRERALLEYSQGMPGAIRAYMDAGDFMLYHPLAWHLGNYLPGRKRITIHGAALSAATADWARRWKVSREAK